jgi:hypothetical protein
VIATVAALFGISSFRLIAYAVLVVGALAGALTIRQHYIDKGYSSALAAVKKQDDKARAAAETVERKATVCTADNGYWDVVTQGCKLEDAP